MIEIIHYQPFIFTSVALKLCPGLDKLCIDGPGDGFPLNPWVLTTGFMETN